MTWVTNPIFTLVALGSADGDGPAGEAEPDGGATDGLAAEGEVDAAGVVAQAATTSATMAGSAHLVR